MTSMNNQKKHSKHQHVFAVFRIDTPVDAVCPESSLSIIKVFRDQNTAEEEVARLNELNSDKGCRYSYQMSRLVSDGESLGSGGKKGTVMPCTKPPR